MWELLYVYIYVYSKILLFLSGKIRNNFEILENLRYRDKGIKLD